MIKDYQLIAQTNIKEAFYNGEAIIDSVYADTKQVYPDSPSFLFSDVSYFSINKKIISSKELSDYQNYIKIALSKDYSESKFDKINDSYKEFAYNKAYDYLRINWNIFRSKVKELESNTDLYENSIEIDLTNAMDAPKNYKSNLLGLQLDKNSSVQGTLGFYLMKDTAGTTSFPIQNIFIENNVPVSFDSSAYFYDVQLAKKIKYAGATINLRVSKTEDNSFSVKIIIKLTKKGLTNFLQAPEYPPQIPSVSISSYSNVSNKLLLLLQKNSGNSISVANDISLFTEEQKTVFEKIIKEKSVEYKSDLIFCTSQNDEKYFIVYRIDKKPQSYSEIISDNNIVKKLDIQKLETSFIDNVVPNKKYYYCFRVQDNTGIYSDASLIYENEIIDQSGTIYMTQNIFKPEKKIKFIKQLDFENRVRIYPTHAQIKIPNELFVKIKQGMPTAEVSFNEKGIPIAKAGEAITNTFYISVVSKNNLITDDSIFESNKIFKARIQSQNSKKKFDLNINYTLEIVDGIKLLSETKISKNFDILKTESLT